MKKQLLLLAMMLLPMVAGAYSGNAEINKMASQASAQEGIEE